MRLDHLLSKENIVIVCFVAGWVLVSAWLVTRFFGESKCRMHFMCGVLELIKQRLFAVFQPYWLEGFLANVFVFGF